MDDAASMILDEPVAHVPSPGAAAALDLRDLPIAPPDPALRAAVVVPVRDEAAAIPSLIRALARQRGAPGSPTPARRFELILLCNGCRDGSPTRARRAAAEHPHLRLHVLDLGPDGIGGGVGRARRMLMDLAADRLARVGRLDDGVVLTTDADTLVAPDWLAANLAEIEAGADAVGGQVLLHPADLARLPEGLRRRYLEDHSYQRLRSILEGLLDPDPDDPLPRHHQHAGASLAVTVEAYWRAGGMPPLRNGEDEAFYRAVRRSGGRFRHSLRVRTSTSGRLSGRAGDGLAGTLRAWRRQPGPVLVESARSVERRLLGEPQETALELIADAIRGLRALIRNYSADRSRRSSR